MSVSTDCFIFSIPSIALANLLFHSNENGLVTTPTVKIPISLAIAPITGAAPVPVPHHIPAVMNSISVPVSILLISSADSSAALRPFSGFAPAPSHLVTLIPIFN